MAAEEPAIRFGEWLTIIAVLVGPVLAVQAQKWVERRQAKTGMKDGIFRTLMATRAARLAPEHVQALNMIDIAFYGKRSFGRQRQSNAEVQVCIARRVYFDVLNVDANAMSESRAEQWAHDRDEKFYALLAAIAIAQNFDFNSVDLKRAVYSPVAHGTIETDQEAIRVGLAKLLKGEVALPMRVVNLPDVKQA